MQPGQLYITIDEIHGIFFDSGEAIQIPPNKIMTYLETDPQNRFGLWMTFGGFLHDIIIYDGRKMAINLSESIKAGFVKEIEYYAL